MKNTLSKVLLIGLCLFTINVTGQAMAFACGDPDMPACPPIDPPLVINHPPASYDLNNDPVAAVVTDEDVSVNGMLNAEDIDEGDVLTFSIVANPTHGVVSIIDSATGAFTYTPDLDYFGTDSFTFKANDGKIDGNIALANINIRSMNDAPVLTLNGDSPATVVVGTDYVDPGAVCTDVEDGVLSVNTKIRKAKIIHIEGDEEVSSEIGYTYRIYYYCYDSSEQDNSDASAYRDVTVVAAPVVAPPTTGGGLLWSPAVFTTPSVAARPVGQVLGASTSCGIYVKSFLRRGYENDIDAVKKLQEFLNNHENAGLAVSGVFDSATENAVKAFQLKHANEILKPWGLTSATGIFYLTTAVVVNNIMCPSLNLPTPTVLVPMSSNREI